MMSTIPAQSTIPPIKDAASKLRLVFPPVDGAVAKKEK
jgi:hypothetical protein